MNLVEKLKLIKGSKGKNQRTFAGQSGISIRAMNAILNRKPEYGNLFGEQTPPYSAYFIASHGCSL